MKNVYTALKQFILLIIPLINLPQICNAQIKSVSPGVFLGIGEIKGNSAPVTSFGGSFFLDLTPWFSDDIDIRFAFTFARKIEYFIPENRQGRYYPFIKSFSLKGILKQKLKHAIYLEQGAGIIILNDRTFGDVNEWEPGASFNILAGLDLCNMQNAGFMIGLGLDYGLTFTKTTASYYIVFLQTQYSF